VARILPTLVVLALLGCTAAAFAVTESLKLEKSPVFDTHVGKVVAPDSLSNATVPIQFQLRKPDRVTVEIVNGSGETVRTIVRKRSVPRGTVLFSWNGRSDAREVVPDGTYRPRVHLAREHRTILLPNPIRMDATPPVIKLVSVRPRVLRPDTGAALVRVHYKTSERAQAIEYVDGDRRQTVRRYVRTGKLDWRGKRVRSLAAGPHRVRLRALDFATNLGPPSRALTFVVRYIELRPHVVRVKTGRRFGFRVLNAKSYAVHLGGLHVRRSGGLLVLRAPKPGRYLLRVNANGHVARAVVVVRP
jgi:flagellar hook capping protein FlgD